MPAAPGEPAEQPALPPEQREGAAVLIDAAVATVAADYAARAASATGDSRALLEATALMAADPSLVASAKARVTAHGTSPARAVWAAAGEARDRLVAIGGQFAERARDVDDVRDRLVAALTGRAMPGVPRRSEPFVLAAADLAPADTATLDPSTCVALVTEQGGPTSHTAILARALGLPAVVAGHGLRDVPDGTLVLVDGSTGTVGVDLEPADLARLRATSDQVPAFDGTGMTSDGHRVQLLANVAHPGEVGTAVAARAEGVGLLRTEFCFLGRATPPPVEEQVRLYRQVLSAFPGRTVVIRTLDAGADKPLPYLPTGDEPNPALGMRGYRLQATRPEVLGQQLEAIAAAAAAEDAEVWVMAPMVSTAEEAASFVAQCAEHRLDQAGVMVETPAAALTADQVLEHARFASLGTNDLAQYTMAADRSVGELAALADPWQPAVLRLVQFTVQGAGRRARPVSVCGEAACDPALAVVLVGLGVDSLSMTPRALAGVAASLARTSTEDCERLAALALEATSAAEARRAVRAALPVLAELGL